MIERGETSKSRPADPVAPLAAAVDGLLAAEWTTLPDDMVLEYLAGVEVQLRRLAAVDHRVLSEVADRALAGEHGCRDTVALLGWLLQVEPRETARRLRAARQFGPRRALTGERLPAAFPIAVAAVTQGELSAGQAQVIASAMDALPAGVVAERGGAVEEFLTEQARTFTARELRILARRLHDTLDPDGRLADDEDRARQRRLTVHTHPDGTVTGSFATDVIAGEALLTYLDAAARPVVDESGLSDPRTAQQRRHDALRELLLATLCGGTLPAAGGVSTTIVLTMTDDQLTGDGPRLVRSGHGALIPLAEAQTLLGDAQVHRVQIDTGRQVHGHGPTRRIFTEGQRLALIARDRGCSFPGCQSSPAWCQAHHVVGYADGGPTSIDNGTLLCGYHHRHFARLGWQCTMRAGLPEWRPPSWIDPTRSPRSNPMHHLET